MALLVTWSQIVNGLKLCLTTLKELNLKFGEEGHDNRTLGPFTGDHEA